MDKEKQNHQLERLPSLERRLPVVERGLFFGAFDPPHLGHAYTAQQARDLLNLKELWFVPSAFHRFGKNMTDLNQRVQMLKMLTSELGGPPLYRVTPLEKTYGITDGKSYRVLEALHIPTQPGRIYTASRYAIILGADNYAGFCRWYEFDKILEMVPVIFIGRPGVELPAVPEYPNMHFLPSPGENSPHFRSSLVRQALNADHELDLNTIVPEGILRFVASANLYRTQQERMV